MNHDQVAKSDFPTEPDGYDRPSVDAHLAAVAAAMMALEAQVRAVEVERDALRRNAAAEPAAPARLPTPIAAVPDLEPFDEPVEEPEPEEPAADETGEGSEPSLTTTPEPSQAQATAGASQPAAGAVDDSGARLVAMKMALDGVGREEVRAKLDDEYSLGDVEALLDDVFKRVG